MACLGVCPEKCQTNVPRYQQDVRKMSKECPQTFFRHYFDICLTFKDPNGVHRGAAAKRLPPCEVL